MTTELGLNLAGVERVLALEEKLAGAQRQLEELEEELQDAIEREDYERASRLRDEIERRKGG